MVCALSESEGRGGCRPVPAAVRGSAAADQRIRICCGGDPTVNCLP